MNNHSTRQINRKNKRKKKRTILIGLFLMVIVLSVITYGSMLYFQAASIINESYEHDGRESGSELSQGPVNTSKDNISLLIIGVDQGGSRNTSSYGLSDTLMVATFNQEQNSVNLLSIPRDSYVYIPERDVFDKINHAHSFGGHLASIETVETLLEIPIHYYVKVNFDAFIDVVDALGGIDVEVPYTFSEMDSNDTKGAVKLEEGLQRLDGEQALALARTRRYDSDIERGKRQQEILAAMVDEAISLRTFFNVNNIMRAVGDNMTTSMTFSDITNMSNYVLKPDLQINMLNLEGTDMMDGVYYYNLDEDSLFEVKQQLQSHLELDVKSGQLENNDNETYN